MAGWIVVSVSALAVAKTAIQTRATSPLTAVLASAALSSTSASLADLGGMGGLADLPRVRMNDLERGALLFREAGQSTYFQAPTLATDVNMNISGMVAQVSVKQQFTNPGSIPVNGVYVFPLPENAAVFGLKMHIGERVVEGQIKERTLAKRIYRDARESGKRASLVEQERPNIFTTSLANIGPGESIIIELQYQQTLEYDQHRFSIRFPMVVATRYIPGNKTIEGFSGSGWARNTDQVPDAQRISPPFSHSKRTSSVHPVRINVQLDAGFPLASLRSTHHDISKSSSGGNRHSIQLKQDTTPANRDFELAWIPKKGEAPQGALFTQSFESESGPEHYALLMVLPQRDDIDHSAILPREIVYLIDTSGSMSGESMQQAKEAVRYSLSQLQPRDTFQVIQFNSKPSAMSHKVIAASSSNISRALTYVDGLQSNGGTEVAAALELAFASHSRKDSRAIARLRQIVLLTDGSVGNEANLFKLIAEKLADSRLFTIGIGSSPNGYFMREAAHIGRGSFTYIGNTSDVSKKMVALFDKMATPVVSDLKIIWSGTDANAVEIWPSPIPDVYLGEPVIVSMKIPPQQTYLNLQGSQSGSQWSTKLSMTGGGKARGLDKLWASHKLSSLAGQQRLSPTPDEYRVPMTELALKHHLLSKYTSLVAVDRSPAQKPFRKSVDKNISTLLPHGNKGLIPQTATPAQIKLLGGLALLLVCAFLYLLRPRPAAMW